MFHLESGKGRGEEREGGNQFVQKSSQKVKWQQNVFDLNSEEFTLNISLAF